MLLLIGLIVSLIWIAGSLYIMQRYSNNCGDEYGSGWLSFVSCLGPNEVGDLLAGMFAPLAFLFLVLAVLIQAREFRAQRDELGLARRIAEDQRNQLKKQAREHSNQNSVLRKQLEMQMHEYTSKARAIIIGSLEDQYRELVEYLNEAIIDYIEFEWAIISGEKSYDPVATIGDVVDPDAPGSKMQYLIKEDVKLEGRSAYGVGVKIDPQLLSQFRDKLTRGFRVRCKFSLNRGSLVRAAERMGVPSPKVKGSHHVDAVAEWFSSFMLKAPLAFCLSSNKDVFLALQAIVLKIERYLGELDDDDRLLHPLKAHNSLKKNLEISLRLTDEWNAGEAFRLRDEVLGGREPSAEIGRLVASVDKFSCSSIGDGAEVLGIDKIPDDMYPIEMLFRY